MQLANSSRLSPTLQYALLFALLALTFWVYWPGLKGGFLFDDYFNIVDNKHVYIERISFGNLKAAALSSDAGLLKRPLSMMSFALDGYIGGINPKQLKTTNLLIHLANGVLVFVLTRLTFRCAGVPRDGAYWPVCVTALWLLAPVNLTSILYVVQRMTSLSGLFTFAGLCSYVYFRLRHINAQCGAEMPVAALLLFTFLAAFSKENGVLLPFLALCYELTVLEFKTPNRREWAKLWAFYVLSCLIPALLGVYMLTAHPEKLLGGYEIRDFTMVQRVLTETRVVWLYLRMVVLPSPELLGMYHDDIPLSLSLFMPPSTFLAAFGLLMLLVAAWLSRKKHPLIALGILLFFVGHSMESTIFPLEIAHEHRNYFPSFGIFLSLCSALRSALHNKGYILAATAATAFLAVTSVRASLWGDPMDLVLMEVQHHPFSSRSNYEAGRVYSHLIETETRDDLKQDYYLHASPLFLKAAELDHAQVSGLLGKIWIDTLVGLPSDSDLIKLTKERLRNEIISPATAENLRRFHECELSGRCKIPGELIYDLLLAGIANPKTSRGSLISLMSVATTRALQLRRYQEAFDLARDAVALNPADAQLGLNYAEVLVAYQFFDEAKKELDRLALLQLDTGQSQELIKLKTKMAQLPQKSRQ